MSWRSAALFLILLPLALLVGPGYSSSPHLNRAISAARARLAETLGPCRPAEGRLTGGFSYAPYDSSRSRFRLSRNGRIALRKFSQQSFGSRPEAIADRSLLKLLDGNPRQAVEGLEAALVTRPTDAALLSDLSAAYMADAQVNGEAYSRVKALEAAENAVTSQPSFLEARFNRALALEGLFLTDQARLAWDSYLQLDHESAWAREARNRKSALGGSDAASRWALRERELAAGVSKNDQATIAQIVRDFPQATREYAEERLFGEWAAAVLGKRSAEAREKLAVARAAGITLARTHGEDMVAFTVDVIDRVVDEQEPTRLHRLAAGHFTYQEGLHLYNQGKFAEARERFAAASSALHDAASPFSHWATFRLAVCEMQLFHYETALALLAELPQTRFRSLAGRSLWVQGLILGIQGKYAESVPLYRLAIQNFAAIGESENLTVVRSMIAEGLALQGDLQGAWKFNQDALSLVKDLRNPIRRQQILEGASSTALQGENPSATLDFLQEALGVASPPPTPAALYCLRRKALAHGRLQQWREAAESLQVAKSMVAELPDEDARKSMLGDLLAAEGRIVAVSDPAAAIAQLSRAIQIYSGTEYSAQLALLFSERARAYRTIGNVVATENDLKQAVSLVQSQRTLVKDAALRASYLEEFRSIFDDMVDLQLRLGRGDRALDYAESARSQVLLELLADLPTERPGPVLTTSSLQAGLPRHVALIEYQVLPRKLLTWVVRRDSITISQTEISSAALKLLVDHFRRKIRASSADLRHDAEARRLSALLVGGIGPALKGAAALVIVPDRDLHAVPFAALVDEATGSYLVERYALSMVPSGKIYLDVLERERGLGRTPVVSATVFGDPAFDRSLGSELLWLPKAQEEARKIASIYPKAQLRLGLDATRSRFLAALGSSDVIHFAGHAVNNAATPQASFLVLAPAGKDSGVVYARDLYKIRRSVSRLVVLSACSSLVGKDLGREGVENLARPFLAMGIPAVVASLWQVSDRPTSVLLAEFHRRLHGGASFGEALRQAQLMMFNSADPVFASPASWAGFQLNGVV